jgi:hypothetical protein
MTKRLDAIAKEINDADPVQELRLVQERLDLQRELTSSGQTIDMAAREAEFIKVAKDYSARNGFSYQAWRTIGVEASVLKKAGIGRAEHG